MKTAPLSGGSVAGSFNESLDAWWRLVSAPTPNGTALVQLLFLQGSFNVAVSAQSTILPLYLASLGVGATELGGIFAGMAVVQALTIKPFAWVGDKFGKKATLGAGCVLISASFFGIPLVAGVALLSLGASCAASMPLGILQDCVEQKDRAQATALLRMVNSIGLFAGA